MIGKEIFPEGCYIVYDSHGRLSEMAKMFLRGQTMADWTGHGAEHPCYGCRVDDCKVRQVEYHDNSGRFLVKQKNKKDAAVSYSFLTR